jgi:hypothetical protein
MIDTEYLVSPQPVCCRLCTWSATILQNIAHSLLYPPTLAAVARGLHLIINRLYCYVAMVPQAPDGIPAIIVLRLVFRLWRQKIGIVPRSAAR